MEPHGGRAVATAALNEGPSSYIVHELDEEAMQQMNIRENKTLQYPDRPKVLDCTCYIRAGLCTFGMVCKFNYPAERWPATVVRSKGGYPERPGQPDCQYYITTGQCKFGATCKFHHPKDEAGIAGRVQRNILGYPLHPECACYLRTGLCKFGNTCKFHHPELSNGMISVHGSPVYIHARLPTNPGQQSYTGGLANWPLLRMSSFQVLAGKGLQAMLNYFFLNVWFKFPAGIPILENLVPVLFSLWYLQIWPYLQI